MNNENGSLKDREFKPLPLGEIKPRGWLETQLKVQAKGMTGHLDEFWPYLRDNRWLGGKREGWERGPYYADGLVPLAFLLNSGRLIKKSKKWIEAFLDSQRDDGWIGPTRGEREDRKKYDPWPNFVVMKVLRQYYEITGNNRVIETMIGFYRFLWRNLNNQQLFQWGKFRWGDAVITLYWLFEKTNKRWLLQLAEKLHDQGYDWTNHFRNFQFRGKQPINKKTLETHVVNNAMGIKDPGIWYRQSHEKFDREAVFIGLNNLDRFHGQATGVFSGDEHFAGKDPSRGTELCAVVEFMYSLEKLISTLGSPALADQLERITFNALPATFKPDMWAHQYDQQVNQVLCNVSEKSWSNGPDANIFGLEPEFGCCTANMHQGWPKFTSNLFMKNEAGLVAVAYSPCRVETQINRTSVTVIEETDYPFEDEVVFSFQVKEPTTFGFTLRIPEWAESATVELEDQENELQTGKFHTIVNKWKSAQQIRLKLNTTVELERRSYGSVTAKRGPLVLSKPVKEEWKRIGGELPHGDWELYPKEPWNYALARSSLENPEIVRSKPEYPPFSQDSPPVIVRACGKIVDGWELKDNRAGPIPHSPVRLDREMEEFKLIPYGCTNLRVTEFPFLSE